jgi:hypothetical protein
MTSSGNEKRKENAEKGTVYLRDSMSIFWGVTKSSAIPSVLKVAFAFFGKRSCLSF